MLFISAHIKSVKKKCCWISSGEMCFSLLWNSQTYFSRSTDMKDGKMVRAREKKKEAKMEILCWIEKQQQTTKPISISNTYIQHLQFYYFSLLKTKDSGTLRRQRINWGNCWISNAEKILPWFSCCLMTNR